MVPLETILISTKRETSSQFKARMPISEPEMFKHGSLWGGTNLVNLNNNIYLAQKYAQDRVYYFAIILSVRVALDGFVGFEKIQDGGCEKTNDAILT